MSNYYVGDKFVIEIEEVFTGDMSTNKPAELRYRMRGFNTCMFDKNGLDRLERLDGDYVNENFGELQDEAYGAGRNFGINEALNWQKDNEENAYNKGLNDAWELAKKILLPVGGGGIETEELNKMFDVPPTRRASYWILKEYTPQQALAKIEAYEKSKSKIEFGDVVKKDGSDVEWVVMATSEEIYSGQPLIRSLEAKSRVEHSSDSELVKTGKHIDISAILAEIGKE